MNQRVVCELCGTDDITIISDILAKCEYCGAYIDLEDYDDSVVDLEKMTHKAEEEEYKGFLNKDMWDMLKGSR